MRQHSIAAFAFTALVATAWYAAPTTTAASYDTARHGQNTASRPCGGYTLWASNAATAQSYDRNGDRLECYDHASGDPYAAAGRDNKLLPRSHGYKFYSFGGSATGVTSVDPAYNEFTALVLGQEDDPDPQGCRGMCNEVLSYDANDRFFVDRGHGSHRVTLATFERHLQGADRFSMIYETEPAGVSIFSLAAG
jgi:hypothetical protein